MIVIVGWAMPTAAIVNLKSDSIDDSYIETHSRVKSKTSLRKYLLLGETKNNNTN